MKILIAISGVNHTIISMAMVLMKQLNFDVCNYINEYAMNEHLLEKARQRIEDDYLDITKDKKMIYNDFTIAWHNYKPRYTAFIDNNYYLIHINRIGKHSIYIHTLDEISGQKDMDILSAYMKMKKDEIASICFFAYYECIDGTGEYCRPSLDCNELIRMDKIDNYDDYKDDEKTFDWETDGNEHNVEDTKRHKAHMLWWRQNVDMNFQWLRSFSREYVEEYATRNNLPTIQWNPELLNWMVYFVEN